jgi:hypothetical protein
MHGKGGDVRKIILAAIFVMPFGLSAFGQTVDTFYINDYYVLPCSTVVIPVYLHNQMFVVGGFSVILTLSDSTVARFVSVQRGNDATNFEYYNYFCGAGTIRITAIVDMPGGVSIAPWAYGDHEAAKINLEVDANASIGMSAQILFDTSMTRITDTTGYWVINPITKDGTIIIGTGQFVESQPAFPRYFTLNQNYPNPFNGETKIRYEIRETGFVILEIFDIQGRRIFLSEQGNVEPGVYDYIWTGKDRDGNGMPSGIYFYRLSMLGETITKKMVYLK